MKLSIKEIIKLLDKAYPLTFYSGDNPFKVLISVILSQRTRDENTAIASKKLFSSFDTVEKLANARTSEVEKLIKNSGFYNVKAKRIKEVSRILLEKYNGKVPDNIDELLKLPGVGRKTANCVLVYAFRKPAMPVDTHVHRISNRVGLVKTKTPEQTEKELVKVIPEKYWIKINELLVKHGQNFCKPITPMCSKCPIIRFCNYGRNLQKVFK
jgi:endonuclease-3